jgi:hypothetical protein
VGSSALKITVGPTRHPLERDGFAAASTEIRISAQIYGRDNHSNHAIELGA